MTSDQPLYNKHVPNPLFVFEVANNHLGKLEHGRRIIETFSNITRNYNFSFAVKLQFRELDTFIHPDFQGRTDLKYVKRFSETRLTHAETSNFVKYVKENGLLTMCTPFDELSVDQIIDDGVDILKIASCSFNDWPLLEKIATVDLPIIASTAGMPLDVIDNVVTFMKNRKKDFALMGCVAQYPTSYDDLQLNQIDLLRSRYPQLRIGYSTHEDPDETLPIAVAIAKGASIFEKHVGIATASNKLNPYSASPAQTKAWLDAAVKAYACAGVIGRRVDPTSDEIKALQDLRRGIYARRNIREGERLLDTDVFFAIPTQPGQITANDWSKYTRFTASKNITQNSPLLASNTQRQELRAQILLIVEKVKNLILESRGVVPGEAELEISHHYGIDQFEDYGITMVTVVNRDYCKKLIVVLPGQMHPEQYHRKKEETFHVLYGDLTLYLDGAAQICRPGSVVTIAPGVRHSFESSAGAVFEEISTSHDIDDSFYTDFTISNNTDRKTFLSYWLD